MPAREALYFPAPRRKGLVGVGACEGLPVFLCGQRNCQFCNLSLREQLRGWPGGKLEVELALYKRPSLFKPQLFYSAHLVSIIEKEKIDTGGEVDVSVLNTICLRTSQGLIVIDPGMMGFNGDFPLASLIGGQRIVATLISHGHQDHWNLAGQVRGPIYLTRLASRLIDRHLASEWNPQLARARNWMRKIEPGQRLTFNSVQIGTFLLPHTIPETMGIDIKGSKKRMVYLGDFRLSGWNWGTRAETISRLEEVAGQEEVDVLALNIVNAHLDGFTFSEGLIIESITDVLMRFPGRVIITCFSTNLERIKQIAKVAGLLGRPAGFCGAGMENASKLLGARKGNNYETILFVTGCQAEEWSVLWRIAKAENSALPLRPDDTIVFSSRCIPGNETNLRQMITALRPQVGGVIVNKGEIGQVGLQGLGVEGALTHVSGHECGEGLTMVLKIVRPKQVLVWPQQPPQIKAFRKIAEPLGIEILPETERVIEV